MTIVTARWQVQRIVDLFEGHKHFVRLFFFFLRVCWIFILNVCVCSCLDPCEHNNNHVQWRASFYHFSLCPKCLWRSFQTFVCENMLTFIKSPFPLSALSECRWIVHQTFQKSYLKIYRFEEHCMSLYQFQTTLKLWNFRAHHFLLKMREIHTDS